MRKEEEKKWNMFKVKTSFFILESCLVIVRDKFRNDFKSKIKIKMFSVFFF